MIIGTIIGSGIFVGPSIVARYTEFSGLTLLVWTVCGLLCFCGAVCYAELGGMMPRSGGQLIFLREAYSPLWSFLFGWTSLVVIRSGSLAAISVAFATYFGYFVNQVAPYPEWAQQGVALVVLVSLAYVNYRGIRQGGFVQDLCTFLKVAGLCALIALGLSTTQGGIDRLHPLWPPSVELSLIGTFSLGMIAALGAYDGWDASTYVAEEIKNPRKLVPLSILLGLGISTVIYLLVNLAYLYVLSNTEVAHSERVAADTMERVLGPAGGAFISIAVLISTFGTINANLLSSPRLCYAMAKQRMFFQWVARVHPTYRTPDAAILVLTAVAALQIIFLGSWETIVASRTATQWVFYLMSAFGLFILRRTRPDVLRPYRTWGYPFTLAVFLLVGLVFFFAIVITDPTDSFRGLAITALGIPVYWLWVRKRQS